MQDKLLKFGVLSSAVVGIEFEFYSAKSTSDIAREIGRLLNKKSLVSKASGKTKDGKDIDQDSVSYDVIHKGHFDKKEAAQEQGKIYSPEIIDKSKKVKKSLTPTASSLVLKRDYSGGKEMNEVVTGPLPYEEARVAIIKVCNWIKNNGWTDDKCSMHLNVSFNPFLSKLKFGASHIEPLKLILSYDEKFVYDRFPRRKNNVYARSIYQILPVNKFIFQGNAENIDPTNFIVPDEKYYGINFTKRVFDYLEFRYVGGKDYERSVSKTLEILDYSILKMYETLVNPGITLQETEKLRKIVGNIKKFSESFSNPKRFFLDYPNINVLIDLKGDAQIVKSYWTVVREHLFALIIGSEVKAGVYNYDSDMAKPQFRYGKLKNAHELRNFELLDCEFEGSAYDTTFFRCKITSSRLEDCALIEFNEVKDSMLEYTTSFGTNTLSDCYINCPNNLIEGKIQGGVIRGAIIGARADVREDVLIVKNTN